MHTRTRSHRHSLTGLAALGVLLLTSCSGDDAAAEGAESDSDQPSFGALEIPLSWVKTWEFAGMYFAEDGGYYEEAGFESVNLISGGPSATPAATQLVTGDNLAAMSNPIDTASLIEAEGENAPVKIIGSVFQQNAFSIFSLAENPAETPEDLEGMTVGVAPGNEPAFYAFLEVNDISQDDVDVVSIQGDAGGLLTGEFDASIGFATNQATALELEGAEVVNMMLADHGLPFAAGSIVTTEENIEENREELKAFLEATVRGWQDALNDPEAGVEMTVEDHGADQGLDPEHQQLTAERQMELMTNEWTEENGLLTMSDDAVQDTLEAVKTVGYELPDDIFDMTLINEVYEENPDLIEY
ncbi:ABC transporter substrate-binding protein [Nesterenkonia lutea]|uniref:Thiamine pyrimidine synthase n=1 Tax=Nesterenkonia lutea TaxID=272919 RepID=A0ABR9JFF4_9MICC|nr:ABC transporter substrate-binding protein [Nesterenkonia lutea]MBE1524662.1 ABC-type nitrate/sulfonate/bicarbonate transport system substrate-binding protein [Nesterenkonia lutea]